MSPRKLFLVCLACANLQSAVTLAQRPTSGHTALHKSDNVTTITIKSKTLRAKVHRFGINLGGQGFYDSSQILANLVARNPGFEGEIWQSILRCDVATRTSCTQSNQHTQWPTGFLNGAHFEVISGKAEGLTGVVKSSTTAASPGGVTLQFAPLPRPLAANDFLVVRMERQTDATAGWWTETKGGARFGTETGDLGSNPQGRQAVRIEASGAGRSATLSSYFDSTEGHSFLQLKGSYLLRFRAKPLANPSRIAVSLTRLGSRSGRHTFLSKDVALEHGWHEYSLLVQANDYGTALGTVGLQFAVSGTSVLLDDVSLTPASGDPDNPTSFRAEVVRSLRALRPGLLRYMDSGASFGSSLDNLLLPEFARQRAGYSIQETRSEDIPIGLMDFLGLCVAVGADPWISLPAGLSPEEAGHLIDFLAGPTTTDYGARRARLGRAAPWTQAFRLIHLELGNEQWNTKSFAGATIADPVAYAHRAGKVFGAMRHTRSFSRQHFDLIAGTWNAEPHWTGDELASAANIDTVAIAPYLFAEFNDASNAEAVFGPMLAQPEQLDSRPTGVVARQAGEAHKSRRRVDLAAYEVNLGTMSGSATQGQIDAAVPSWGGALAVADHMLLMLRDQGINTQALFCLGGFRNAFTPATGPKLTMPLWGAVVDMGGATNRKRPTYLVLEQINRAVLSTMLQTTLTGANPTWNQPLSRNDNVQLSAAHELQTFAFKEGAKRSLIILNLSRTKAHAVQLAPGDLIAGDVEQTTIAPAHLSDSNETAENVRAVTNAVPALRLHSPFSLAPGSMTVFRWTSAPPSIRNQAGRRTSTELHSTGRTTHPSFGIYTSSSPQP